MSRGAAAGGNALLPRIADWSAKVLVPAAAALTLVAIATSSARDVDHDLHVVSPDRAAAGQFLPVRALLYAGLHRPEGATLLTARARVQLIARDGRVIAAAELRPGFASSMEAELRVPAGELGEAQLKTVAKLGSIEVRVEQALEIVPIGALPPLEPHERPLPPLERYMAGPVRVLGEQPAPDPLALAIGSGACVPEQRCELYVHVGSPAAGVRLLATPSVTPDARSAQTSAPTTGVVCLHAITHGPEAELTLVAERSGVEVARRGFRLAVALGADSLAELPRVLDAPARPALAQRSPEPGCIVDAFREGRWLRSGSLRDCRTPEPLPFAALEPGIWRLQVRRDPFASESAAVHSVYVRSAGEDAASVLTTLARAALERAPHDALALAAQQPGAELELEPTAGYLLALLDEDVIALPAASSSFPRAMLELATARAKLRRLALLALVLCALTLGLIVAQRGLSAASEASRLMAEAGAEASALRRQRVRMTLRVLWTVTSLLLAFVAIAAYVVARSHSP